MGVLGFNCITPLLHRFSTPVFPSVARVLQRLELFERVEGLGLFFG